jgi:hypothetical protein
MTVSGGDFSRRSLERLALEEFKRGHLTKPELRPWIRIDPADTASSP